MSKNKKINRKISIIIIILAISGGLIYYYYFGNQRNSSNIQVSENQQNIILKTNQEFTITFNSNRTTGYSWQLDNSYNKNIINYIDNEYKAPKTTLLGAPGHELWNLKAINRGSTTLQFNYSRAAWAKNATPINTKIFNITVN